MLETALHIPVLLPEVIDGLNLSHAKKIIDCTLGLGGHSEALLKNKRFKGTLMVIDQDAEHLEMARERLKDFGDRVLYSHSNFSDLERLIKKYDFYPDGILYDLGVASPHFDNASRGFSYQYDGPLDMRMNPEQGETAADLIATLSAEELQYIFQEYGEEPLSKTISLRIVEFRRRRVLKSTFQLRQLIESVYDNTRFGKKQKKHPATRVFQALRIVVNDEMKTLKSSLKAALELSNIRGRIVVISYHSLEDRIVKCIFKQASRLHICRDEFGQTTCEIPAELRKVVKKPLLPQDKEISKNPRSRSAKMRIVEKISDHLNYGHNTTCPQYLSRGK